MIEQVTFANFKCLRDVAVTLERFTVIVGANGSGKTSILQGIDLLCRTFRTQQDDHEGEYVNNRSFGATDQVELTCKSGEAHFRYRTRTQSARPGTDSGRAFARSDGPTDWKPWQPVSGTLPSSLRLRLNPNALRTAGAANTSDPRLMQPNGQGLHSVTASMNLEDPELWLQLQADLRQVVPAVIRLRHTPQSELLFDTVSGKGLKADQVSEGTLLTLGLLAAVHGPAKPGVLLLDDLDRGLHPKAQWELVGLLRGVLAANPDIQVIATTHSPYLLDKVEAREVRITSLRDDGATACEPLTRHPKFDKWKDEFHPGEMWSVFGEKWVAEPEASAP